MLERLWGFTTRRYVNPRCLYLYLYEYNGRGQVRFRFGGEAERFALSSPLSLWLRMSNT